MIGFVQQNGGRSGNGATSFQLAFGAATAAGALLIVCPTNEVDTTFNVTDDQGNAYAESGEGFYNAAAGRNLELHRAENATAGVVDVTATPGTAGGRIYLTVHEHSGDSTFLALDPAATNSGTGTGTLANNVSVTTTVDDSLAFAVVTGDGGSWSVNPGSWTGRASAFANNVTADQILAATGQVTSNFGSGTSQNWLCIVVAFADDSQLGGGTPVSNAVATPIEYTGAVRAGAPTPVEHVGSVAAARATPIEWVSPGSVAAAVTTPIEYLGTAVATRSSPLEWLSPVSRAVGVSLEWLESFGLAWPVPVEWVGGVRAADPTPFEWMGAVRAADPAPLEWLGTAVATLAVPIEWTSPGIVTRAVAVPLEWLAPAVAAGPTPVEWVSPVSRAVVVPIEHLGGVRAASPASFEHLGGVRAADAVALEWLGSVRRGVATPLAWLGPLGPAIDFPVTLYIRRNLATTEYIRRNLSSDEVI